ncbi:MAG: hypothetical protein QOG42_1627, partial [Solirubrobacteraceae bacterium]|nr:hypothetical protein [Solirubrobacteraceae bacterium]
GGSLVWLRAPVLDLRGERAAIVAADATGRSVGHAAYERVYGPRAVLTLDVEDDYWPLGLPEALLFDLCRHAAGGGIAILIARVREPDARLLALLLGQFGAREAPAADGVDLEIATTLSAGAAARGRT